jgi:hypothetical protein
MRRPHLLIASAWLIHAAAWFLPVIKGGVTLPDGLPGWEAFRIASCALWPCRGTTFDTWYGAALSSASSITTILFVLASPWVVLCGLRSLRRASAWAAATAFIVNAHWYVLFGSGRSDLRMGYYLWWLSFLVLAIGLFDLSRGDPPRP